MKVIKKPRRGQPIKTPLFLRQQKKFWMQWIIFFKNLRRDYRAMRPELNTLLLLAFTTIFLTDFWFSNIPELFHGGAKLGELFYKICQSYVTSYVFYFFVAHYKSQRDKERIAPFLFVKSREIIQNARSIIGEFQQEIPTGSKLLYPTLEDLMVFCSNIDLEDENSPLGPPMYERV